MSVTYGFYNSLDHDRVYDAVQFSSIFDGIINDGVYMSIGDHLAVSPLSGMEIIVGTGRAWFNHTWTLNDSLLNLEVEPCDLLYNRIDTVILEVNEDSRENDIKILKGVPAGTPSPPGLTNNESLHQYALADIAVARGTTLINVTDITNRVGTSTTPFVTGIIETINIDSLIANWTAEWDQWNENHDAEYNQWISTKTTEVETLIEKINTDANQFIYDKQVDFENWFNNIQDMLDGDVATKLADRITQLESRWVILGTKHEYRDSIESSDNTSITATDGSVIQGRVVYEVVDK